MRLCLVFCALYLMAFVDISQLQVAPNQQGGPAETPGKTCQQDGISPSCAEHGALKESVAKLMLAINYDFVRVVGQKIFVSDKENGTYSKASEFCNRRGLEVARPENDEENKAMTQFIVNRYQSGWIHKRNIKSEQIPGIIELKPPNFSKLSSEHPDDPLPDGVCTMMKQNGDWATLGCTDMAIIICQI